MHIAFLLRRIILSSVACLALLYFYTLSHKRHDFHKKCFLNIKCVLTFSTTSSEVLLILRRIQGNTIINLHRTLCTARYYCQILIKLVFSRQMFENPSNVKRHENTCGGNQVVLCGRTDRHDMTKLTVTFLNFAYAAKNGFKDTGYEGMT
jgi:hypothetical protein